MSEPPAGEEVRRKPDGNLRRRILSAVVLGVVVLVVAWLGGVAFRLLAAVMAAAVFYEWRTMMRHRNTVVTSVAWLLLAAVLGLMVVDATAALLFPVIAVAALALAMLAVSLERVVTAAAGFAYAALPAAAIVLVRGSDFAGVLGLLFLFTVVWATDIVAFFVGRAIGGPKLAPSISPGKTWSGAIGGTVGAIATGLALVAWAGTGPGPVLVALTACLLSVVSQAGDLFESAFKRRSGVKDSGWFIPGHGGVMDRVDGLVAAAFVFYLMGAVLAGAQYPARAFFA